MTTTLPLPLRRATDECDHDTDVSRLRLPAVLRTRHFGPVLQAMTIGGAADVAGLNVTRGCAHRCPGCYVRGAANYPTTNAVYLVENLAGRLDAELSGAARPPRAVYLCPSTDPFPPLSAVQRETARVVEVLAAHGVEAWLMTRGWVRPPALAVLAAHARHVRATVGFTTCDRVLQQAVEPWAAPPRMRLRQLDALRERGVAVQVALEPLLPGLTDTRENLEPLLAALAARGVRHVTAGYLFLREGTRERLAAELARDSWGERVAAAFEGGPILTAPGQPPARYLPRPRRQRGYALLMTLAAEHGISVSVSRLTNPDFAPARR
jgi:DNA repair photolyase